MTVCDSAATYNSTSHIVGSLGSCAYSHKKLKKGAPCGHCLQCVGVRDNNALR
jgi:hypothetical protein